MNWIVAVILFVIIAFFIGVFFPCMRSGQISREEEERDGSR